MGRLLEPVGNGRSRLMIEVPIREYKTRLTGLQLFNPLLGGDFFALKKGVYIDVDPKQ
jgi:hypothetical protein